MEHEAATVMDATALMEQQAPVVAKQPSENALVRGAIVLAVGLAIWLFPLPSGLTPAAWHLFAIFVAVILGFILKPLPGGAIVILGVGVSALVGAQTPREALSGFSDETIWTMAAAFFLATGFAKTGLGRRVAYLIIYAIGNKTLRLSYAVMLSDAVMAPGIPSNTARVGGLLYPVVQSLCSAFGSEPGPTSRKIGAYLMLVTFMSDTIVSSIFMTASAANLLVIALAESTFGVKVTWGMWFLGAIVPGLVAFLVMPYLIYKLYPPEIKETPEARQLATAELRKIGKMKAAEKILIGIFLAMLVLWCTMKFTHIDAVVVALLGTGAMLATKVIDWKDALAEKHAWDTLVWMGGMVALAHGLSKLGLMKWFADAVGGSLHGVGWPIALVLLVLCYLYAHYAFASVAAHVTALFLPLAAVGIAAGAPKLLLVMTFGYATHLTMSLTHYSCGPAPIYFGAGYVDQATWWKFGLLVSLVNVVIWGGIGVPWLKVLGVW